MVSLFLSHLSRERTNPVRRHFFFPAFPQNKIALSDFLDLKTGNRNDDFSLAFMDPFSKSGLMSPLSKFQTACLGSK
jgi:hypothetical protein